ncbi:AraC family transcriptional regulator [Microbacterium sp. KUDC0406]|uniref:AraC family transcriptional regulator n=1 Tax=Microbacterium sp. KUDC0406 TaxID=2909588 RepID=UPI001F203857|nr:AraC family transcriptional regulator [Microbacterium sp. KUDC0406]UJP10911.1 AraC family transcriptional regulator [Microbacterium sp. KUDC0406]
MTSAVIPPISLPARVHDDRSVLLWQARGSSECVLDGRSGQLTAGHALWIPAGVVHELTVHEDSVALPMHFIDLLPGPGTLAAPTWIAVDAELRTAILAVMQVQNSLLRPDADVERRLLRMLRGRSVPPTGLRMPQSAPARAIAEHLRDHPGEDASVAELAAAQHVSARTLERAFAAETGMTLQEWRARRRMETAAAQLSGDRSPAAVAISVGYRSVSAFRRSFKDRFGMTPGEYARAFRVRD